jgi:hypothetical protein
MVIDPAQPALGECRDAYTCIFERRANALGSLDGVRRVSVNTDGANHSGKTFPGNRYDRASLDHLENAGGSDGGILDHCAGRAAWDERSVFGITAIRIYFGYAR